MGGNILRGVGEVLSLICNMLQVVILASVVISWLGAPAENPIVQMVRRFTEPIYRPFRKITQRWGGPFDMAPLIVWLIIISFEIIVIRNILMAPRA